MALRLGFDFSQIQFYGGTDMVWKKYEDQTIDEALQNRYTGYLQSRG